MDTTGQELSDAFGLVVDFTIKPGHTDAFDELMRKTVADIRRHEPRTLAYVVQTVEGDPQRRVFYELYADAEAFEHHERQAHTLHFKHERDQHIAAKTVDRLGVVTAAGRVLDQDDG
ncbi:MAG: antibiotic biosynthesis monooxygenase [Actinomycetota bacterium]